MFRNQKSKPRGASNALPIVILSVVALLLAMGVWMWIDMSRNDLVGKAKVREDLKNQSSYRPLEAPIGAPAQPPVATPPVVAHPPIATAQPFEVFPHIGLPADNGIVECRRVTSPIIIDGLPSDDAWKNAQIISNFSQSWLGPNHPARGKTVARLLWDDQFLYFLAEMDDLDIYADTTQHNADLWNNDVFELFLKPSTTGLAYYEFEINAQNATLDLFFPSRGSGGMRRWAKKVPFHLETKVTLRGASTLNNPTDRDIGWIVEGRIPWSDFSLTGGKPNPGDEWRFALCRYDYSVYNEDVETSSSAPLTKSNFHQYEDYSVLKFK